MNELDLVDLVLGDTIHLNPTGTVYLALTFQEDGLWLMMMTMMMMKIISYNTIPFEPPSFCILNDIDCWSINFLLSPCVPLACFLQ